MSCDDAIWIATWIVVVAWSTSAGLTAACATTGFECILALYFSLMGLGEVFGRDWA